MITSKNRFEILNNEDEYDSMHEVPEIGEIINVEMVMDEVIG